MIDSIDEVNSIFEQPWWLNTVAEDDWEVITVNKEDGLKARFVFCRRRIFGLNFIYAPPNTPYSGPWLSINPCNNKYYQTKEVYELYDKILNKLPSFISLKLRLSPENQYLLPFIWGSFKIKPCYTYRMSNADCSNINQICGKTILKNLKKASRLVVLDYSIDIDRFWIVLEETFLFQKRKYPVSKELIRRIIENSHNRKMGRMVTALDVEGNVHAASYFVYDKKFMYAILGGSIPKYRNSGAKTLIYHDAISYCAQHGLAFDFEGSMIKGIENFFRQFGGTPQVYFEIRKLPIVLELFEHYKDKIKKLIGYKV